MYINTLLIISIGVCTALIAYFSFFRKKDTITTIVILLAILAQFGLTVYKGILDSELQNNLKTENVTINWKTGQIVNLTDNKPVTSFNTTSTQTAINSDSMGSSGSMASTDSIQKVTNSLIDTASFKEIPDMDLPQSDCILTGNEAYYFHGRFLLVSNLPEKIILYRISSNREDKIYDMLISPGKNVLTPLIRVMEISNKPDSIIGSDQATYYFKTVDGTPIKYGQMVLTLRSCKIRTQILTSDNLNLASKQP